MKKKIIEYIIQNRISTTEVADCLGKAGVLPEVLPLNDTMRLVKYNICMQFRIPTGQYMRI